MEKIKSLFFRAKMNLLNGADVIDNTGFNTEEVVIRYKEFYFTIYINQDTGEPYDWGWSTSPMTHVPIRDFYTAKRGKQ